MSEIEILRMDLEDWKDHYGELMIQLNNTEMGYKLVKEGYCTLEEAYDVALLVIAQQNKTIAQQNKTIAELSKKLQEK